MLWPTELKEKCGKQNWLKINSAKMAIRCLLLLDQGRVRVNRFREGIFTVQLDVKKEYVLAP